MKCVFGINYYLMSIKLSFISGLHNESSNLALRVRRLVDGLERYWGEDFELILVENGSVDNTPDLMKEVVALDNRVRTFCFSERGLGLAYKKGIDMADGECIMLSAIDLPFGFSDLAQISRDNIDPNEIIFFSKSHKDSIFPRPVPRRLVSKVLNFLLLLLFRVRIRDTQGSIFLPRNTAKSLLKCATSPTLFFTAQLAIYAEHAGFKLKELPVSRSPSVHGRKSTFKIFRDGISVFYEIAKELHWYGSKTKGCKNH